MVCRTVISQSGSSRVRITQSIGSYAGKSSRTCVYLVHMIFETLVSVLKMFVGPGRWSVCLRPGRRCYTTVECFTAVALTVLQRRSRGRRRRRRRTARCKQRSLAPRDTRISRRSAYCSTRACSKHNAGRPEPCRLSLHTAHDSFGVLSRGRILFCHWCWVLTGPYCSQLLMGPAIVNIYYWFHRFYVSFRHAHAHGGLSNADMHGAGSIRTEARPQRLLCLSCLESLRCLQSCRSARVRRRQLL